MLIFGHGDSFWEVRNALDTLNPGWWPFFAMLHQLVFSAAAGYIHCLPAVRRALCVSSKVIQTFRGHTAFWCFSAVRAERQAQGRLTQRIQCEGRRRRSKGLDGASEPWWDDRSRVGGGCCGMGTSDRGRGRKRVNNPVWPEPKCCEAIKKRKVIGCVMY